MQEMTWNLESEYPSFDSDSFNADLTALENHLQQFPNSQNINLDILAQAYLTQHKAQILISNLWQYTSCNLSVDRTHALAKKIESRIEELSIKLSTLFNPFHIYLQKLSDSDFQAFIKFPEINKDFFYLTEQRKLKDLVLTEAEENKLRSRFREAHFLDQPLHNSRMTLKDTGIMTVEDLIQKHFKTNLSEFLLKA